MRPSFTSVLVAAAALLVAMPALPRTAGMTDRGESYATGGVGAQERDSMVSERSKYSLWIQTAVARSGAFLSDARVAITDNAGKRVLVTQLDGPWLFVNLKPGQYKIEVVADGQTMDKQTRIGPGDHREMVFRFDLPGETLPKGEAQ